MKNIFDGILIASDLDGTLITGEYTVPGANLEAVRYFCENGGSFAFCTGRAYNSCAGFVDEVKPNVPCILLNGAMIFDCKAKKPIWEAFLSDDMLDYVKLVYEKFPTVGVELFGNRGLFILRLSPMMERHLINDRSPYTMCTGFEQVDGNFYKALFVGEPEEIAQIEEFAASIKHDDVTFVTSAPSYLELIPTGVNKGNALLRLAKILGIEHKNTYAIGDYYNDAELIRAAGTGVCVASAPDSIKRISDLVVCNCEQGSIARLVSHILTKNNQVNQEVFKMDFQKKKELQLQACRVRQHVIEGTFNAKSGHPGGSLSATDIITYLYFAKMNVDPANPAWNDRDRFVLSKGHAAPALYGALAEKGFFDPELIKTLRHPGSILQGHPDMKSVPGVDMSTGSLGQGISTAVGMAIDAKVKGRKNKVYAVLGDGEIQEGQVWEAAMLAAHKKLDNLVAVVDNNNLQIDGEISTVVSPYPIIDKFAAFGWYVLTVNGHDFDALEKVFAEADSVTGKPVMIVASTVKGKGVSFMENKVDWHGVAPNAEQYAAAMEELEKQYKALEVM
ncbi:MAG: Cof-type HAD-IIB family hydrolase [Clostridia bacterium]|nr:Cof-type HAD-IIB family hydrolase [Clostridia bacterium]